MPMGLPVHRSLQAKELLWNSENSHVSQKNHQADLFLNNYTVFSNEVPED